MEKIFELLKQQFFFREIEPKQFFCCGNQLTLIYPNLKKQQIDYFFKFCTLHDLTYIINIGLNSELQISFFKLN